MKNINFIKPISPAQASSMRMWLISSLFLGISLIVCMGIATLQDYFTLRILKLTKKQLNQNMSSFNTIMQRKQELKKQEHAIQEQLNVIANANKQTQQQIAFMVHIKKALKNSASLESFSFESAAVQLCIDCTQTQHASEIISSLGQMPDIASLHMSSLQPKQQGAVTALRLNLRGTIKQNT